MKVEKARTNEKSTLLSEFLKTVLCEQFWTQLKTVLLKNQCCARPSQAGIIQNNIQINESLLQIYRIKRNGAVQFGMVIENSEFASSDEESDEHEFLIPGKTS